jgi:competence protein ComK
MKEILTTYNVNEETNALTPAFQLDYQTIVLEGKRELFVKQTPLELIKLAAKRGGAEYNGRRTSMTYLTGIHKKIPIPINPQKNIYAFPTTSPNQAHCSWIFFHHVDEIKPTKGNSRSIIQFKNGREIKMNESLHILEKQMYRTWLCKKALNE